MHWDDIEHELLVLTGVLFTTQSCSCGSSFLPYMKALKKLQDLSILSQQRVERKKIYLHYSFSLEPLPCLDQHRGVVSECLNCFGYSFRMRTCWLAINRKVLSNWWNVQPRRPDKNYSPWNIYCIGIRSSHLFSISAPYLWTIPITLLLV